MFGKKGVENLMKLKEEERSRIFREVSLKQAQMVKNLPAMQETRVQSLNWEAFHGQRNLGDCSPWSHKEVDVTEVTEHAAFTHLEPN